MREIIFDTETTGFDPSTGHRIVEIGCIEIVNRKKTGNIFHHYIDPERDMPEEAFRVHGISLDMLKGKPFFRAIAKELSEFLDGANLIAHNAPFDAKFVNYEFSLVKIPALKNHKIIDTLMLARKKFPGAPATLDALCKRFNIDLSKRDKHGALLDADLLYEVYIELTGGMQNIMVFDMKQNNNIQNNYNIKPARTFSVTEEENLAHIEFMKNIKNPMWND